MKVVPLRPESECENVVKGLRALADLIEQMDDAPEMAVVVLASERVIEDASHWRVRCEIAAHQLGKSHSLFVARGMLASAIDRIGG